DHSNLHSFPTRRSSDLVNANKIRTSLEKTLIDDNGTAAAPTVKIFGPSNQVKITTKLKANQESTKVDEEIKQKIFDGVKSFLPRSEEHTSELQSRENLV